MQAHCQAYQQGLEQELPFKNRKKHRLLKRQMFLLFSAKMNGSGSNAKLMVYGAVYFVYLF